MTQEQCDRINTLRDYERIHAIYMQTSVFSEEHKAIKEKLDTARKAYIAATKAAHPNWLVM